VKPHAVHVSIVSNSLGGNDSCHVWLETSELPPHSGAQQRWDRHEHAARLSRNQLWEGDCNRRR